MITIYKYPMGPLDDRMILDLPKGAKLLTVQLQHDNVCLWAMVDTEKLTEPRSFRVFGTGHEIPADEQDGLIYLGSIQMLAGKFVAHVFEQTRTTADKEPGRGTCGCCQRRVDDHNLVEYQNVYMCSDCRGELILHAAIVRQET